MRVIFAGGGTGGHLFPGVAAAEELKRQEPDSEILFVIDKGLPEPSAITYRGFAIRRITAKRWRTKSPLSLLLACVHLAVGFLQSLSIIRSFKPDVVVGLGGYVSCPVVFAGVVFRKTTIIQEQNYIPGMANRLLSGFANEVELSFPETKALLSFPTTPNVHVTGNPIRENILTGDRAHGIRNLGLKDGKLNLIIFGGSQGARRINTAILETFRRVKRNSRLLSSWQIVHITGAKDYDAMIQEYKSSGIAAQVFPFVENMGDVYAAADLVVCRAGAGAIAELTAVGLPAIYVPYPWASDNHQEYNARWVCEKGGGVLVLDNELETGFSDVLVDLMENRERREEMVSASRRLGRPDAAKNVVERILRKWGAE